MVLHSRMLLLASALPFVAGCGAYLHRPELETSTVALKTSFGQLSAPAYLEAQQKHLAEFAAREDRTVAEFQVASRNFSLLNIIRAPADDPPGSDGRPRTAGDRIREAVETQLGITTGGKQVPSPILERLEAERTAAPTQAALIQQTGIEVQRQLRFYGEEGGTFRSRRCQDFIESGPPIADPPAAKRTYGMVGRVCRQLTALHLEIPDCDLEWTTGRLVDVCDRLRTLRAETASAARQNQLLRTLNALSTALQAARAPTSTQFDRLLRNAQEVREFAAPEDIREVLTALDALLGASLVDALDRVTEERDRVFEMPATEGILAVIAALDAVEGVRDASARRPSDQPTAILIAIAKVRHQLNLIELDIALSQRTIALLEAEAAALREQAYYLAQTHALCSGSRGCSAGQANAEALSHLVNSFNRGLIPYEVLRSRELQVGRAFSLRRAQAAEADYRALLQPAIDQIAAYGEGGLRPDVLGPFLASLPISSAILGR